MTANKIKINIDGPQGNAFALMGIAKELAEVRDMNYKPILEEMTKGDYNDLLLTFINHFGDFCELVKDEDSYGVYSEFAEEGLNG